MRITVVGSGLGVVSSSDSRLVLAGGRSLWSRLVSYLCRARCGCCVGRLVALSLFFPYWFGVCSFFVLANCWVVVLGRGFA